MAAASVLLPLPVQAVSRPSKLWWWWEGGGGRVVVGGWWWEGGGGGGLFRLKTCYKV